jgi:hypothetical protein
MRFPFYLSKKKTLHSTQRPANAMVDDGWCPAAAWAWLRLYKTTVPNRSNITLDPEIPD